LVQSFKLLKEDNKQTKKQIYGLAILCVSLFIGTITGTVMAIKNSKETIVDKKTGVMKVNDGGTGGNYVSIKAQGTTFQTTGTIEMKEETTTTAPSSGETTTVTNLVTRHGISSEDVAKMWSANEQGTDVRLVILDEINEDGQDTTDTDTDTNTEISSIEPVTIGRASWKKTHIIMGGMTFIPNEGCTDVARRKSRKRRRHQLLLNNNMNSRVVSQQDLLKALSLVT
jgi:hypothetical protein